MLPVLGALLLSGLALAGAPTAGAAESAPVAGRVVLVGASGLRWSDVSADVTPVLWHLIGSSSVGSTSVRSARPVTCPADGWLTISAGVNATSSVSTGDRDPLNPGQVQPEGVLRCDPISVVGNDRIAGWDDYLRVQREVDGAYGTLGTLGDTLAGADVCATAVGPGAGAALADLSGEVARYTATWTPEVLAECPITVVDAGAASPRELDDLVREVVEAAATGTAVIVTGVADPAASPPPLQLALEHVVGRSEPSWLFSDSTRGQLDIVAVSDLAVTLLTRTGIASDGLSGAPWQDGGARDLSIPETVGDRRDVDQLSEVIPTDGATFGAWLAVVPTAVLAGCLALALAGRRTFPRVAVGAALFGAATLPASYLVSTARWWAYDRPTLVLVTVTIGTATAIALAGVANRSIRPWRFVAVLSGLTFVVLSVDGLSGTPLQAGSILGAGPVYGGRFFGFGNVTFTIYAAAVLLLAAVSAQALADRGHRTGALLSAAGIGALAVVVDGWPSFGADFGGVLALVPGVVVLLLLLVDVRLTYQRLGLIGVAGVAAATIIAVVDYLRPADQRTHMGDFVDRLLSGEAGDVLSNKADALSSSLTSPLGLLEVVVFVGCVAIVLQPTRWHLPSLQAVFDAWPALRASLIALAVTCTAGTLVNDSGALIAGLGVVATAPLLIATCVWWTTQPAPAPEVPSVSVARA